MEKELYTDEFEQLVKEKADEFRMYPSKRVWHSIYNNLHPSRRWPSVVMTLFLITSLMLIGHLNTSDNAINRQMNTAFTENTKKSNSTRNTSNRKQNSFYSKTKQQGKAYNDAFEDVITNKIDFFEYTVVKNNRPFYFSLTNTIIDSKTGKAVAPADNSENEIIQSMDNYIKSKQILSDVTLYNKTKKSNNTKATTKNTDLGEFTDDNSTDHLNATAKSKNTQSNPAAGNTNTTGSDEQDKLAENEKNAAKIGALNDKTVSATDDKEWIENFAFDNAEEKNKWKKRFAISLYATPAVNYRKLSTESKGSATAFANADINSVTNQKPGFGIETGLGLTYALAKRLQLKGGLQFNYTNYNINADQTSHPVLTSILLNDPYTGLSYPAARISTTSNSFSSTPIKPVKLHNRTYQISLPVGFAYKLSSKNNVDWFAGATFQPTYVFAGNAHIISSDLKSYVSEDPSYINNWNMNLGFETYMNFKLGTYQLQVGPQVRYQLNSTYNKKVALIEKPYAFGLKFGLIKGF